MNLFFDPKTGKFFDVTKEGAPEINYCYPGPAVYIMSKKMRYQIDPEHAKPGNKNIRNIFAPESLRSVIHNVTNLDDYMEGYGKGTFDGQIAGERQYMLTSRTVSFEFVLGYELGFLYGIYAGSLMKA